MKLLRCMLNRNLLVLAAFGATLMPQALRAQASQNWCSPYRLRGTYIFSGTGTFAPVGPLAAAGIATYDGLGNVQGTATQSFAGTIYKGVAFTGVYKVNGDCTGSVVFTYTASGQTSSFDFVVTPQGDAVTSICTDPGGTLVLTSVRVGIPF